jgi:hypothetical protein
MGEQKPELTREELEAQEGAALPEREVMSMIDLDPGLISIPKDPTIVPVDDPRPDST